MAQETQAPQAEQASREQKPATPSEAAVKAQEVGKKLTGFFGGLAEKAKNIDVKELAEKAKNIDVKELAEKAKSIDVKELTEIAKQKVNEVKDKAAEMNAAKAEKAEKVEKVEHVPFARETVSPEKMKETITAVAPHMMESLPPVAAAVLADVAQGDKLALRTHFAAGNDVVFVALSQNSLYYFTKSADQFAVSVYPVSATTSFSLLAPRGKNAGHLTVVVGQAEIKLVLSNFESYVKALLLYKKLREFSGK